MRRTLLLLLTLLPGMASAQQEGERRPGMAGHIEPAVITSGLRFRLEHGSGVDTPDRAEFFHAKCGCYQLAAPPFYDPAAPGPGTGIPWSASFVQAHLRGDYAFAGRLGVFLEASLRSFQPDGFWDLGAEHEDYSGSIGIGDLRLGLKGRLLQDARGVVSLVLGVSVPTGDAARGMGKDHWTLEPTLLIQHAVSPRWGTQARIGLVRPLTGSVGLDPESEEAFAGSVLRYALGPSVDLVSGERFTLTAVVEAVGWQVLGGFQTSCEGERVASEEGEADVSCRFVESEGTIINANGGLRIGIQDQGSVYVGFGKAVTEAVWFDQLFRLEYRRGF